MTEPLSPERLAEIRQRAARCTERSSDPDLNLLTYDVPVLLAEIERLGRLADSSYSAARQKDEEIEQLRTGVLNLINEANTDYADHVAMHRERGTDNDSSPAVEARDLAALLAQSPELHGDNEPLPRPIDYDDIEVDDVVTDRHGTRWQCESMCLLVREGNPSETLRLLEEDDVRHHAPFLLVERPERTQQDDWPDED